MSDRPITPTLDRVSLPADMKGLKVRTPKNEVMLATFEAFGAEPVPLAWSETPRNNSPACCKCKS